MPSQSVKLPAYVIIKHRKGAAIFYFQVPRRLRPQGWPPAVRLPISPMTRTGRGDAAEIAAVSSDGNELYAKLLQQRGGKDSGHAKNTLPWLIQSFEQWLKETPRAGRKKIGKKTLRNYAYAARVVTTWSAESNHPDVALITRPAVLQFLATMNRTPTKRRFLASYLRSLMFHAMDLGIRPDNPAMKVKTEVPDAKVHIWTDGELITMVTAAEEINLSELATAMLIAHDEGPRPVDILHFQRFRDYTPKDGCFRYFQQKTDEWVVSPAGQRVKDRLAKQASERLMLVVNRNTSCAYNERVFNRDFDRIRERAKLPHLQFRHLRHTFVVKAKRAGLDSFAIASKTGHSEKSVRDMLSKHYLPHDSEVASNATAALEAYRANRERKSDTTV